MRASCSGRLTCSGGGLAGVVMNTGAPRVRPSVRRPLMHLSTASATAAVRPRRLRTVSTLVRSASTELKFAISAALDYAY